MIDDNISEFNAQVTRAIATLYKAHPTKINLGAEHILAPPAAKTDTDFETRMEFATGTLTWLVRNGLVTGDLNEDGNSSLIFGAQLSARSYETFIRPEGHASNKPLGQLAISASLKPGTKEESDVAELVARRLLKG
jgi:hypothetical protein